MSIRRSVECEAPAGARYEARTLVGVDSHVGRLGLSRQVLARVAVSGPMGRAWLRHNVEEVGNVERFLRALYEQWLAGGDAARACEPARSADARSASGRCRQHLPEALVQPVACDGLSMQAR